MTQPLQVLLIDDNPSDRALIIRVLQREFPHVQVQEIIDAAEFKQALTQDAFDAVVTDYQLRWSNGLEILRTAKACYPRCPVIMFTNTGTEEVAVEALQAGLDDYILKEPNRYIRVPVAIRVALDRISSQKRAALIEIRLQRLLNQVKIGIFRSNSEGTLIDTNPAFLELIGVQSLPQANEMKLLNLHHCYERLVNLPPPQQQEQEIELQRGDGTQIWVLLTTTLNTIEGITVVEGLLEDITQHKQAETLLQQLNTVLEAQVRKRTAQLQTANQELEQLAEKLTRANQDLEEFAYSVSHDVRAPLRIIQGFAGLLLEDWVDLPDETKLQYLKRIRANARQLDTLIIDLLAYSRLRNTNINLEPVNLSAAIAEVLIQLEPELQQRQSQIEIQNPLPIVQGNRLILMQVLTNLLSNAIKFMASNQVQPAVRIWAEQRELQTRLWIEDNGIGIDLEQQEQIFRPFTRLHSEEEYPGTGIGLAIVRKGIERMGGLVGVESQTGQGSRFWLELTTVTVTE